MLLNDVPIDKVFNQDNATESPLRVLETVGEVRFANLFIDAPEKTVIELCLIHGTELFSQAFHCVDFGSSIDILDISSNSFYFGRDWAMDAYGKQSYGIRSNAAMGFDTIQEGVLATVDNIFRPLVAWGYKLDKILGLK